MSDHLLALVLNMEEIIPTVDCLVISLKWLRSSNNIFKWIDVIYKFKIIFTCILNWSSPLLKNIQMLWISGFY